MGPVELVSRRFVESHSSDIAYLALEGGVGWLVWCLGAAWDVGLHGGGRGLWPVAIVTLGRGRAAG